MAKIEFGGIASDFRFDRKPVSVADGIQSWQRIARSLEGIGIELQPELYFLSSLPRGLTLQGSHSFIGVHQPCHKRDYLSPDPQLAEAAKKDTAISMDIASAVGADYLVLHPVQADKWENREAQRNAAVQYVESVAREKERKQHSYRLCVENLEYPKYPSTFEEIVDLLDAVRGKGHDVGLIFDIAHHWHNNIHLLSQVPGYPMASEESYYDLLYSDLVLLTRRFGPKAIEGFHISQAYIHDDVHNTHGLPGLIDGKGIAEETISFSHPPSVEGPWLDAERVLHGIGNWMRDENIPGTKAIIESHHRTETELAAMALILEQVAL